MADEWTSVPVRDIRAGDRVRLANGEELLVARVDPTFMGMDSMIALIEDTPQRWYKAPMQAEGTAEVLRSA